MHLRTPSTITGANSTMLLCALYLVAVVLFLMSQAPLPNKVIILYPERTLEKKGYSKRALKGRGLEIDLNDEEL